MLELMGMSHSYFIMIQETVDYIEDHLDKELGLSVLADRCFMSESHFYRMFRSVTGYSLKHYLLGRRLSKAAVHLKMGRGKVVDVALDAGFQSHEVFSRNFRQWFGVTPTEFRRTGSMERAIARLELVERKFKNENKDIVVHYTLTELQEIELIGKPQHFCPGKSGEIERLKPIVSDFVAEVIDPFQGERLINIIRCDPSMPDRLHYFMGTDAKADPPPLGLLRDCVPASQYGVFQYKGSMGLVHPTVMDDLYKWIVICKIDINHALGVDLIEYYEQDYDQTGCFRLLVPVK
ncbi:helix-turn-helix domain-containing protein [Paenibacillus sp. SI8]|uniref:helix-turn-helix domain-containing protein n=1 Tax=unclassified Paenibacillus TaxID=185978 RepID=UPI003466DAC2